MTGNPSKLSSAGSKKGKAGGWKQRPRCPKRSRAAEPAGRWDRTGIRDPGWRRTGGWWCWRERERAGARWKGSVADGVEAAGALALGRYGQPGLSATVEARACDPPRVSHKPFAPANAQPQMPASPGCPQPQLECAAVGAPAVRLLRPSRPLRESVRAWRWRCTRARALHGISASRVAAQPDLSTPHGTLAARHRCRLPALRDGRAQC